ncbi:MAG: SBBP repeat-containing protein [Ginsengibacter sp.]
MKKIYLLLAACVSTVFCFCQIPTLQWAKAMDGSSYTAGRSVVTDAAGNVYTTGYFAGTVDFDPGPAVLYFTAANVDIFVTKLDASGNLVWAKQMGGPLGGYGNYAYSIALDATNNVYTTGYFGGTVDFDPGPGVYNLSVSNFNTNPNINDAFISKLDANGNFVWAKKIDGTSSIQGYSIATDASGNVYSTGFFVGNANFNPAGSFLMNQATAGKSIYVLKLDTDGNFTWAKQMGGPFQSGISFDLGWAIAADASGNVYTTGRFSGTADFDPGATDFNLVANSYYYGAYISKLDVNGDFVWAKQMTQKTATSTVEGLALKLDASGNIYTTGQFEGTIDFDPGAGTLNYIASDSYYDIFVSKWDPSGNMVWAKQMGGPLNDVGVSISLDPAGNVYTSGYFDNTADFNPGAGTANLVTTGYYDGFISKLDKDGNYVWAIKMGGVNFDYTWGVAVDAAQNIYATGSFSKTADFDPSAGVSTLTGIGSSSGFVAKYSPATALPVNFISFTGKLYGEANLLQWTTASETNNDHFEIEHSSNGISFNSIGEIKGFGNSNTQQHYSFADKQPKGGTNYYRLQQIDIDGKYSYSNIVTLKNTENNIAITIYPNPSNGNIAINLGRIYDNVNVVMMDANGKIIRKLSSSQSQIIKLKIDQPAGIYYVKVISDNEIIATQKIIKQ